MTRSSSSPLIAAFLGLLLAPLAFAQSPKPNVLFLFADDQCFETIRALGHTDIETPNLDRLVRRGTTFTHAYNMGSWSGAVCVAAHDGHSLLDTLYALADLGVEQQYRRPMLSAALDHEEMRLPLERRLRESEQRIGAAVMSMLYRHEKELAASPRPSDVQDIFVIAKALIEADAMAGRTPPPDLRDRVVRALWGYLTAKVPLA